MTPKTVTVYNGLITVQAIWLACMDFESVWNDLIGLYGFWVRIERSDWFVQILSPYRTIWLACTDFESVKNDLICLYGFWVRMEQSDWLVRLLSPYGTIWLDGVTSRSWRSDPIGCFRDLSSSAFNGLLVHATSDSSLQTTRKKYVKCVLFLWRIRRSPCRCA